MLWSPDTSIAISYNIKLLLFITLLYFYGRIIFSFAEKAESIKKMINEYLYSTWIISLIASLTAIVFGGGTSQRLSIGDINPIPLGILLSCGLLSAFILLSNAESNNTRHRYWKFIITLSIFVISYTAIASNNRGPLISLAISTVIFIGARYKFTNPIPAIKISSLLAIAIAAAYYLLNTYFSEIIERTLYGFSLALNLIDNSSSGNLGESLDIRLDLWESAWKIFSNNPIIGVGAGGYSSLSFFDYPHNLTLEILSLYGIIGLAFMLTLIAMTIRKFIIGYIYDNLQIIGMGCLLLMTFLESQISLAMWMNKHMIVYLAILSAAIISRHQWSKGRRND
ncbi:O-antigen ligase family protein [Deinococcus sp. ME38]|uniref:O-antigen ligase family protein n=1 Tax=Deinococcus sp. ME38 TaxID=3400344 RepID=UPI003B5C279B